jgi:O-acetyl-ADP-ribose deacetylase
MTALAMEASVSPVGAKCKPIEKKVGQTTVHLIQGDLTALPVEAWVYYAREDLAVGSGFGTAIQMRGGVEVKNQLAAIGAIKMGEAVITGAGMMKAKHIIHACGPKFQEKDLENKLRACMMSALKIASDNGIKTLAFPPMGTGFYGVPLDLSAGVMADCFKNFLAGPTSLAEVIVCVMDLREYGPFKAKLDTL